jgi:hypothetical protein
MFTVVYLKSYLDLDQNIQVAGPFENIQDAINARQCSGEVVLMDGELCIDKRWWFDWEKRDSNSFVQKVFQYHSEKI